MGREPAARVLARFIPGRASEQRVVHAILGPGLLVFKHPKDTPSGEGSQVFDQFARARVGADEQLQSQATGQAATKGVGLFLCSATMQSLRPLGLCNGAAAMHLQGSKTESSFLHQRACERYNQRVGEAAQVGRTNHTVRRGERENRQRAKPVYTDIYSDGGKFCNVLPAFCKLSDSPSEGKAFHFGRDPSDALGDLWIGWRGGS